MLKARKERGFFLESIETGHHSKWKGHHATNLCTIRLSTDRRVFLGYGAGGDDDVYIEIIHGCWSNMISSRSDVHDIIYYAYLRVKDFRTGELLLIQFS